LNAFTIIGITAITLLSIMPIAKTAPPTLTIQSLSNQITLVPWERVIQNQTNTGSGFIDFCGVPSNPTAPPWYATYAAGYNFTISLNGKDPGSTFINFKSGIAVPAISNGMLWVLYNSSDISMPLIRAYCDYQYYGFLTSSSEVEIYTKAVTALSIAPFVDTNSWRVPNSGTYTFLQLFSCSCQSNQVLTNFAKINATATWTVTTLS